mmetsp:Transcript_51530/g.142682  ORF Transcript_51530/g.142682 Transcript_51530/m.142682 type:complete len:131 (+) Transcript_51530:76-468(+)
MLSRFTSSSIARSCGSRLLRQQKVVQKRRMGGGGAFMETNTFGAQVGEVFGTIAWLWVFHRFSQDGAVLLGYQHPWEHGDHGHGDHGSSHSKEKLTAEEVSASWEKFSEKSVVPGDDDDDDEEDDDDDDE